MSMHTRIAPVSDGTDFGTLNGTLAQSLLALLDGARVDFDVDAERAKGAIRHAASILRVELERRSDVAKRASSPGELAAWQVRRVTEYVDAHLSERIQLSDLSAVARRSTAHFCRAFKRTIGETPQGYITTRRLLRAQELMLAGDSALSEIAVMCGFSDQAHFCNRFRDFTGTSPAAWRRERRESGNSPNAEIADRASPTSHFALAGATC
jgi:AraC family transcriptional regulator